MDPKLIKQGVLGVDAPAPPPPNVHPTNYEHEINEMNRALGHLCAHIG